MTCFYWGQLHCFRRINHITVLFENKTKQNSKTLCWHVSETLVLKMQATALSDWIMVSDCVVGLSRAPSTRRGSAGPPLILSGRSTSRGTLIPRAPGMGVFHSCWEGVVCNYCEKAQNEKVKLVHFGWWGLIRRRFVSTIMCVRNFLTFISPRIEWSSARCSLSLNVFFSLYHHLIHFIW